MVEKETTKKVAKSKPAPKKSVAKQSASKKVTVRASQQATALKKPVLVSGSQVRRPRLKVYKSFTLRAQDIERRWWLIDANGLVLGRMAAIIANLLRGKIKPTYTPHMDGGDGVIVVNAQDIALKGAKREKKIYYRHTGYPGGIKEESAKDVLEGKHPERVIERAVKRMMGRGPMARLRLSHLKVYAGASHPHENLKPQPLDIAGMNDKNVALR